MSNTSSIQYIGVDIGGTKTQIQRYYNSITDNWVITSSSWRENSDDVIQDDMVHLAQLIKDITQLPCGNELVQSKICIGLHGADSTQQLQLAQETLQYHLQSSVQVVNDAELLGPTLQIFDSINLIVGTGSIVVARSADDTFLRSGGYGYGWIFSDPCSAPALIREAVVNIIRESTTYGENIVNQDILWKKLSQQIGIHSVYELPLYFGNHLSDNHWGQFAPLFFQALEEQSSIAQDVFDSSVDYLFNSIQSVINQGACGNTIIAAGGVITHQPILQNKLKKMTEERLGNTYQFLTVDRPPVEGALSMARR